MAGPGKDTAYVHAKADIFQAKGLQRGDPSQLGAWVEGLT